MSFPLSGEILLPDFLERNCIDFREFEGEPGTPVTRRHHLMAQGAVSSLCHTAPVSYTCLHSNGTNPVIITISAEKEYSVAARFFSTQLSRMMRWTGKNAFLFCAAPSPDSALPWSFEDHEEKWRQSLQSCVSKASEFFRSIPPDGRVGNPVALIYMDCQSNEALDTFCDEILPKDSNYLIRHLWFSSEWRYTPRSNFIELNMRTKTVRASRCHGSSVCSQVMSFLNNCVPALYHIYETEPLNGDPHDTLCSFCPIFFSRHGQSEYNLEDRLGGNPDLTEAGRADAKALGEFFETQVVSNPNLFTNWSESWRDEVGFEIWCSQLTRTQSTAQPAASILTGGKTKVFKALNEVHAGVCEDLTNDEVKRLYPDIQAMRHRDKFSFRYPSGESYDDLVVRLFPLMVSLTNTKKCVLVVGHQAVLRTALSYFGGVEVAKAVHISCPQRTVWCCTFNRLGEPRLAQITLPPRGKDEGIEAAKWSGW